MPEKPQWMIDHEKDDREAFGEITRTLERIENKLDPEHPDYINKEVESKLNPMAENYAAANKLGKWIMALLLAVSLIAGSFWSIWSVFHGK